MKSIVKDENLSNVVFGSGWKIGNIKNNKTALEINQNSCFDVESGTLCGVFNGLLTFVDTVNEKTFGEKTSYDSSQEYSGGSWVKFSTYKMAISHIKEKPEVFRNFTEADIRLKDWGNSGNEVEFDITGDYLDVGRALSGEPEAFGSMRDGSIINDFCSIVVNGNAYCGTDASEIDVKAQRITRLVDMLESNHVRCRVVVIYSNKCAHAEIIVKQYGDTLDIDDVSVATSSDLFRRVWFKFAERSKTLNSGYGRAVTWGKGGSAYVKDEPEERIISVDGISIHSSHSKSHINEKFDELESKIAQDWQNKEDYNVVF